MTNEERIKESCRFIEAHSDEALTLVARAKRASMSQFHFQRSFKALIGVTPKQYHDAHRLKNFKSQLKASDDITQAVFNAGYSSASRVYQNVDTRLGMTPREYRASGKGVHITYVSFETPLGLMMIGATDRGLCFAQFGETHAQLEEVLRAEYRGAMVQPMHEPRDPRLALWIEALRQHLSGTNPGVDLPIDIRATAFQLRVWKYLQRIPYGEVRSYAEVARAIGNPKAARAVAGACASNVLAIVIPCHRVIRGSGELGGYKWGLSRKRTLLDRETRVL